jgi:Ca2+-binding RTX toxin-like protein
LSIEFQDSPGLALTLPQAAPTGSLSFAQYHASIGEDTSLLSNDASLRRGEALPFVLYGSESSDRIIDPFARDITNIALGPGDDLFVGGHTQARSGDSRRSLQSAVNTWLNGIELGSGNDTAFSGGSNDIITYGGGTYSYDQYDAIEEYGNYIHRDGDNRIHTEGGNDTIANYSGNDYFDPGFGDDRLFSGGGDDTIHFGRGYGSDQLDGSAWFYDFKASDLRPGDDNGYNTLALGKQISAADLDIWMQNQDLVVAIKHTEDRFTVRNYAAGLASGNPALDAILFADGNRWYNADIAAATLDQVPAYTVLEENTAANLIGSSSDEVLRAGAINPMVSGEDGDDGIYGSSADDTLAGGRGNDQLEGGEGDDELIGGEGNDYLIGGNDNDIYRFGANFGNDVINNYDDTVGESFMGGESTDAAVFGAGFRPVDISFSREADDLVMESAQGTVTVSNHFRGRGYGFNSRYALDEVRFDGGETLDREQFEALIGAVSQSPPQLLEGRSSRDVLQGGPLADHILGHGGHDSLYGDAGEDTLVGGAGNDRIEAGSGNDLVLIHGAGQGFDTVLGGEGDDTIQGSMGDDSLGLGYFDSVSSVELIDGLGGVNTILGTSSRSVWDFQATELRNIDLLSPGAGHDTVIGSADADTLLGAQGNDRLAGAGGDDVFLVSGSGHGFDTLFGGAGYDRLLGGDGDDVIGLAQVGPDSSLELIDGGTGSNRLQGTSSRTVWDFSATELHRITLVDGGKGHDSIIGSAAADTLTGGQGNDRLAGGGGDDVFIVIGQGDGIDTLYGNAGDDTLLGSSGDDDFGLAKLDAASSLELIDGAGGTNRILGSNSRTLWDFSHTALRDIERLDAGGGHDTIIGSAQDDLIIGGSGNDKLQGGAGADTYHMERGHGHDTVLADGANSAEDLLFFGGVEKEELWFSRQRDDLLVSVMDDLDSVTLEGWFQPGQHTVAEIATDSAALIASQVQLLVDAMADFQPESFAQGGDSQLQDQPELQAALAAAWRPSAGVG